MSKRRSRQTLESRKAQSLNIGKKLYPYLRELVSPAAFLQQLTEKDLQTLGTTFDNASWMSKGKYLANIITGRMSGMHLFSNIDGNSYKPPFTMNPAAIVNKWTTAGAAAVIISKLPLPIPMKGKIGAIGKRAIAGGMVGGFFDAPSPPTVQNNTSTSAPRVIQPPEASGNMATQTFVSNGGMQYQQQTRGAFE